MDYVQLLEGIKTHPYTAVVVASAVNVRMTALLVGAVVAQSHDINPLIAYAIFVVMDVSGDVLCYILGYTGRRTVEIAREKNWGGNGTTPKSSFLVLLFSAKMLLVANKPIVVAAGAVKMPLPRFIRVSTLCALLSIALYMAAGYFFWRIIL